MTKLINAVYEHTLVHIPRYLQKGNVMNEITKALQDVTAERTRQQSVEGWTPEHDDDHASGELAYAATSYAIEAAHLLSGMVANPTREPPFAWPWEKSWWKPSDARRNLVKAGALILAEIERIDRVSSPHPTVNDSTNV